MELPKENFQNEVLRPIIKVQNDFFLNYFGAYEILHKIRFKNAEDAKMQIENCLKSDPQLKNIFIGSVISSFNAEQLNFYFTCRGEISRRIVSIISKRIFDSKSF
jgi:hypothetical protein